MKRLRISFLKLGILMLVTSLVAIEIGFTCSPVPPLYTPVYLSYDDLRNAVTTTPSRNLSNPGKILVNGNYLYVNEKRKGIHVIDNTDPANPVNLSFISVPGNIDLAMKGNTLYADSYVDLVAIDVSSPQSAQEINRLLDIYPYRFDFVDETDRFFWSWNEQPDPESGVIIGAIEIDPGGTVNGCGYSSGGSRCSSGGGAASVNDSPTFDTIQLGSLARMLVSGNHLFLLSGSALKGISIADPSNPALISTTEAGWDIETVYILNDILFIGGQTGMSIYSLANPDFPSFVSRFNHAWQCDPVVAEGTVAYVTLRSGVRCNGANNQLDVIDISDIEMPSLIESYPMENPYGLAVNNGILFVADGYAGIKVFDATNPESLEQTSQLVNIEARDIILAGDIAIVTGPEGVFQFNYSDPGNIVSISEIKVSGVNESLVE